MAIWNPPCGAPQRFDHQPLACRLRAMPTRISVFQYYQSKRDILESRR
jgi:hypothetical protein